MHPADCGRLITEHKELFPMPRYDFKPIESRWQQYWDEHQTFRTPDAVSEKKKLYVLDMFPYPSGAGLHSYGSTTGQFGSRSSGYGVYDVTGGFSLGLTITNSAAIAQRATFSFYITPGLLSNDLGGYTGLGDVLTFQLLDNGCGGDCVLPGAGDRPPMPGSAPLFAPPAAALSGNQFVESGISFDIRKDGSSVWNSSATLRTDAATGTQFSRTGVDLYCGSGSFRSIAGGAYAVDLGTLAAGQSITLTYDLKTHARGDAAAANADLVTLPGREIVVPDQWIEACVDCDQNGPQLLPGETVLVPGRNAPALPSGWLSSCGDRFEFFLDGRIEVNSFVPRPALPPGTEPFSVSFAAPVPEPSTWASMGLINLASRFQKVARARV